MAEVSSENMEGWTAQSEEMWEPAVGEPPQMVLEEMVPEGAPEGYLLTDDASLIDPPGGILVNRETATEEETAAEAPAAEEPAAEEAVDLEAMTKAEIQTWAEENGYEVNQNTMSKAEMIDAIMEQQG